MSKSANKTMIGAFVVGAVVLAVAAVVLFGSGKFFRKTEPWLTFFHGSVKGLNVGSPVVFRGVQIGQVTDIIVGFDASKLEVLIPVFFEVNPEKFQDIGSRVETSDADMHKALISRGMRAQLQMQSLVTGQLLINIDFYPDTPVKLVGIEQFKDKISVEEWWEIPSIPTPLQELEKALSEINIKDITDDVKRAMDGIAKLATSPELHASIGELSETLKAVRDLARNVDNKVEPLTTSLDQTLVEARAGIGDARKLMNEQGPVLVSKIKTAAESATTALDHANKTLRGIEDLANEGTQLRHEVSAALTEIAAASRSVRVLAEFIEQHPDAILRGRARETGGN
jgi:paraquat-inducible protein B